MTDLDAAVTCDIPEMEAAPVAAPVAASVAATPALVGRMRPERIEVVLASDRRREHAPELRARLVSEMMAGPLPVVELSRREGICTSVLHRWLRQARIASGALAPGSSGMVPVRLLPPGPAEAERAAAGLATVGLEVVLGNGRVLRVLAGTDPALVARMAAALER